MKSMRRAPKAEGSVAVLTTQLGTLGLSSAGYLAAGQGFPSLRLPLWIIAAGLLSIGLTMLPKYVRLKRESGLLATKSLPYVTFKDFQKDMKARQRQGFSFLGLGFVWQKSQCQAAKDILATDWYEDIHRRQTKQMQGQWIRRNVRTMLLHPLSSFEQLNAYKSCIAFDAGYVFLRSLAKETPCYVRTKDLEGHVLVLGTTGSGKTQFLCFSIYESVLKGEPIFVIDPKNDGGLRESMREMCATAGREFVCFDVAHPELSTPIDLLANFARSREVAGRIVEAQPVATGDGATFVEMGRNVLAALCLGLELAGEKPTFYSLFRYYTNRKELAVRALQAFLALDDDLLADDDIDARYEELKQRYVAASRHSADMDQVIFVADLDDEMIMKRTLATYQLLAKMAGESLQGLFSPRADKLGGQGFSNVRDLIAQNKVVYIGLDALTDSSLARAVGTMLLADIRAVAGAKYNFADVTGKIRLFVDEAAEVCCEPLIQMLNKGRGAGLIITVATQTISDFVAKLGGQAEAGCVLANTGTLVALRCNDPDTAAFVKDRTSKTTVATTMLSHDVSVGSQQLPAVGASMGERQVEQETELVPSFLLGGLPTREFFAFVAGGHVIKGRVPLLLPRAEDYRGEA